MSTSSFDPRGGKKRKVDHVVSNTEITLDPKDAQLVPASSARDVPQDEEMENPPTELIPVRYERLAGETVPGFAASMQEAGELGYQKAPLGTFPTNRSYALVPTTIRGRFVATLTSVLTTLFREQGNMSAATAANTAAAYATLTADGCMSAIYARLRNIHKSTGVYPTRYNQAAIFNKTYELPLPFALAVEGIGVFITEDVENKSMVIPTYPENTTNEGRSAAAWNTTQYLTAVANMKKYGIPFKKVDLHIPTGTPWWTYAVIYDHSAYDMTCIFPPNMYSLMANSIATMFLSQNNGVAVQIVTHRNDDVAYPRRARNVDPKEIAKAFYALCHLPKMYYTSLLSSA